MSPNRQPTIRDVARQAGVSTATVSRVLAGLGGASGATEERIRCAVSDLGYRANRMARDLRAARSRLIGVVIPDIENPFFTGIVAGIEEVLYPENYTLFLANSDGNLEREWSEIQMLRSERVSGILLIPCESKAPHYGDLANSEIPVVTIDRELNGVEFDSVTSANEKGAYEATTHLIQRGFRNIGLINGPRQYGVAVARGAGFQRALKAAGIELNPRWIRTGDFREEGGYVAMRELFASKPYPRALLLGNFLMALGALRAIREMNLRVPDDLALIAFDEMPWAAAMNPPLSTVAQPVRELGRSAARLLMERFKSPERKVRRIVLDTELIPRGSSLRKVSEGAK